VRLVLAAVNSSLRHDAERILNPDGNGFVREDSLSPAGVVWKSKEQFLTAALVEMQN